MWLKAESFRVARAVVVRGVGACAFVAFASLAVQVRGLVGVRGILPAQAFFERVADRLDVVERFTRLPSLFWLTGATDAWLVAACVLGMIASAFAVADRFALPALLLSYALYLSLCGAGQIFLGYQWDMLLCESLVVAALLTPKRVSPAALLLVWALAARLELGSGLSKLLSGDETWRSLTALEFHFETQPLPTELGWLAHHLPHAVLDVSCFLMFVMQLALPPLLFVPWRRARHGAVAGMTLLQTGIALTGNYTFFNLLTCVLALAAIDDDGWRFLASQLPGRRRSAPSPATADVASKQPAPPLESKPQAPPLESKPQAPLESTPRATLESEPQATLESKPQATLESEPQATPLASKPQAPPPPSKPAQRAIVALLAVALLWLGLGAQLSRLTSEPLFFEGFLAKVEPFQVAGGYGLFANMTTERDEIVVEGTLDGTTWLPYGFKHKPGDVDRLPDFTAPHQPRLDWQMWFAALGTARQNPWFTHFVARLLEAEPAVLDLLEDDPFHGARPLAVRATLWRYRIAPLGSGHAWTREEIGLYLAPTR